MRHNETKRASWKWCQECLSTGWMQCSDLIRLPKADERPKTDEVNMPFFPLCEGCIQRRTATFTHFQSCPTEIRFTSELGKFLQQNPEIAESKYPISHLNFQKVGTDTWSPGRSPTVLTWRWCLSCEKPLKNDKSSCYGAVFCWMLWELRLVLHPWVSRVCWFDLQNESSGPSFETQPSQKLLLHAA